MKKLTIILTLTVILSCLCTIALAASCVYMNGDANVRSGPGLNYNSLGSVNAGSTLSYTGNASYDSRGVCWYSVSFSGRNGWVSSKYASLSNYGGIATYGAGANSANYSGNHGFSSYCDGSVYATGDVNVRTGPGLNFGSIGTLYAGNSATWLGNISYDNRGIAWYQVSFRGSIG